MKFCFYIILALCCSSFAFGQSVCHGRKVLLTDDSRCNQSYILAFSDEFNGNSLDTSVWIPAHGVIRDHEHKIAQQWFTPNNIEVSNGTLKLITKREILINQCYSIWMNNTTQNFCEDFNFTCSQIDTKQKFSHGKIEMSCKIPRARGVGSSFWTFGDPAMNEIDIFEFETEEHVTGKYNGKKTAKVHRMNIHADYDGDGHTEDCPTKYDGPDYSVDFHVFTLIWTPHKLEWYVDGELKRTSTLFYSIEGKMMDCNQLKAGNILIKDLAFPMNPMSLIVDNIVQVGDKAPDEETKFPVYYEIDYIRYYREAD